MKTNGVEIRSASDYDRLPFDHETRELIRRVHERERNEIRYSEPVRGMRIAGDRAATSALQVRSTGVTAVQPDLSRERLRLRLNVLQRLA